MKEFSTAKKTSSTDKLQASTDNHLKLQRLSDKVSTNDSNEASMDNSDYNEDSTDNSK